MGVLCSHQAPVTITTTLRAPVVPHNKNEIQFNAGFFVQENKDSFSSVYTLNESPIGSGAFAEVWRGVHKRTGDARAIKIFNKCDIPQEELDSRSVFMEVEILKSLDHPNVLKVYEFFEDADHYYIVMELCDGGDVFDKLHSTGSFTERYAAKVMKYLLQGLNYLHSKHVVHRDIKPENLLIVNFAGCQEFTIKIIDFNIATRKESTKLKGVYGTTDYMAPEVFSGIYDEKCDVWSCGIVLYMMVSGVLPFPSPNDEVAEAAICKGTFGFPSEVFRTVSAGCKDFIKKLLAKRATARPSAAEALNHPWLALANEKADSYTMKKTIRRMQSLRSVNKLKQVFTTFLIAQISKTTNFKKYEQVFYAIDTDRNGVITKDELVKQLSLEMSPEKAEEQANKMFSLIDNDGSGEIDYTEFLRVAVDDEVLLTKENLRKAFMYFDKDSSNAIEKEELVQWLSSGGNLPEDVINELMMEADINGDGTIDLQEFEAILFSKLDLDEEEQTASDC